MKSHYYLFALLILIMAALACTFPRGRMEETPLPIDTETELETEPSTVVVETEVPPEETTPFACGAEMIETSAFSVEFCYPEQYSNGYSQTMIPANPPSADSPPWGVNPDMIEITLTGYPVINEYHDPIVRIYPVDDYLALEPRIQALVDDLQTLLASGATNPESIPFVPFFNAAQMMQAQVTHLDFRNGKGVRFITQYSQAAMPISNDSAFYAFIGLTDDSEYLVSATLPVNHPMFSKDMSTEPDEGWESFVENFTDYISTMETDLLTQTQQSFFPNLSPLDEMMSSFLIPSNAIP